MCEPHYDESDREVSTYEISVQCRNCKWTPGTYRLDKHPGETFLDKTKRFYVPKGKPVKLFLQEMMCENCECAGYMGLI